MIGAPVLGHGAATSLAATMLQCRLAPEQRGTNPRIRSGIDRQELKQPPITLLSTARHSAHPPRDGRLPPPGMANREGGAACRLPRIEDVRLIRSRIASFGFGPETTCQIAEERDRGRRRVVRGRERAKTLHRYIRERNTVRE